MFGRLTPPDNNVPLGSNSYDSFYARPRFNVFYYLTGFSFLAFAAGFSVCLFDISKVPECVEYSEKMVDVLKMLGDHIIAWIAAYIRAVLSPH